MGFTTIWAKTGTQREKKQQTLARRFSWVWVPAFAGMTMGLAGSAIAQDKTPPYWASIASGQAMMRTGPAKTYPGVWLYQRRDLPVRVLKIYPNWRLVEDPDGARGWMLVTLLSDRRTAIVKAGEPRDLHAKPDASSPTPFRVAPGVVGRLDHCANGWCDFTVNQRSGYIRIDDLWGIAPGETVG